jgi:spectrin alpha
MPRVVANVFRLRAVQAKERRQKLDESYYLHRFLADFRDLVSWINDMKAIISADELAKDVAGAEALLERHQEHKVDTDIF